MPMLPGDADDLLLVHADDRAQHRQVRHAALVTAMASMVWLATWPRLSPVTRRPQPFWSRAMRIGNAHHEPAHDEGEVAPPGNCRGWPPEFR